MYTFLYRPIYELLYWSIYECFLNSKRAWKPKIANLRKIKIFIYRSKNDKFLHISVKKWFLKNFIYRSIFDIIYRQNICFYISVVIRPYIYRVNISPKLKSWNITYMDRYMPLVGIYWSIYVILKWFKRSGLILTDICNGLITPDIWKHIWAEYGNTYWAILN